MRSQGTGANVKDEWANRDEIQQISFGLSQLVDNINKYGGQGWMIVMVSHGR